MELPKTLTTVTPFSRYFSMFLFILFPVVGFLMGMKYQKITTQGVTDLSQHKESTPTIISQPTSIIQNGVMPTEKNKPLLAYIKKENVFIYDPNIKTEKQITKNGSIANIEWTKDGQWLYWYAKEYTVDQKNSTVTFAKGKYPEFKIEILFRLNSSSNEEVFSFYPLAKTNQILIEQRDGLYIYDINSNPSMTKKRLIATKPLGINSQEIKDSYYILDISHDEKFALLSHGGWEMTIDTGVFNLSNLEYRIIPNDSEGAGGDAIFSPDDNYILTSGVARMIGAGDTKGIIYHFPSLEIYKNIDEITGKVTGNGDFLSNNLVIYAVGHGDYYDPKIPYKKEIGISVVNLSASKEILFIPYTLSINYDYPTIPDYIIKASQGFVFYTLYEQPWKSGYYTYDFSKNEITEKTTFPPFSIGEFPIVKPQPIIAQ